MKPFKRQVFAVVHFCGMRHKDAQGDWDALKQRILFFFKGMTFCSYFERNVTQIKIYILPYDFKWQSIKLFSLDREKIQVNINQYSIII